MFINSLHSYHCFVLSLSFMLCNLPAVISSCLLVGSVELENLNKSVDYDLASRLGLFVR